MRKVVYDQELLGLMNLLGKLTRARIKDCFKEGETLYCIVERGEIGKAIGKGGANIKKIGQILKKKVKMVEYGDTASRFVMNLIYPVRVEEVREEEGVVEIIDSDRKKKGMLVGRDGVGLKLLNRAVKRFFDVEVKVV